jgi:polysaccharide export outer membrane protein
VSAALALSACAGPRRYAAMPASPSAYSELDARMYGVPQSAVARRAARAMPASVQAFGGGTYTLDSGDKLRVVVFGQDALSNNYTVDADGQVLLPLIGAVNARGLTTAELSGVITARLKQSFIREPSVAVQVEVYRPFFMLGEVTYPGQYPFVPNMATEKAIAIAAGLRRAPPRTASP